MVNELCVWLSFLNAYMRRGISDKSLRRDVGNDYWFVYRFAGRDNLMYGIYLCPLIFFRDYVNVRSTLQALEIYYLSGQIGGNCFDAFGNVSKFCRNVNSLLDWVHKKNQF